MLTLRSAREKDKGDAEENAKAETVVKAKQLKALSSEFEVEAQEKFMISTTWPIWLRKY
ncbi:MAG: hypothetical protein IPP68_12385 [Elusimicrobia bacterium]|nr:hypothetical protein [Elusimicrobiota bacterium]